MNRHHQSRRGNSAIAPKTEAGANLPTPHRTTASPRTRPTPPSHSNSPTSTVQGFSPAASDSLSMKGPITTMPRQQQQQQQMHTLPAPQGHRQPPPPPQPRSQQHAPVTTGASFYPTPAFQNHIEQLGEWTLSPCAFRTIGSLLTKGIQSKNMMRRLIWWTRPRLRHQADLVPIHPTSIMRALSCSHHLRMDTANIYHSMSPLTTPKRQVHNTLP